MTDLSHAEVLRVLGRLEAGRRFDYYLNSGAQSGGNGKTPAEAFGSVAALDAAVTPFAGMRVGVARDSVFREEINWTADNITVGAYGAGTMPIFDASDLLSSGGWSKTAGKTNIYERTVSLPGHSTGFVNVWEDDSFLTLEPFDSDLDTTLTSLDGNEGGYYVGDMSAASTTLYIHATGSGAPASNGKVYKCAARDYGVRLGGDNCEMRGIHTKNQFHNDGSTVFGDSGRSIGCRASNGHKHNRFFGEGFYSEDDQIDEAKYNGAGNLDVMFEGTATGKGAVIKNITYTLSTTQHSGGTITAFTCHANANSLGDVVFDNPNLDGGGTWFFTAGLGGDDIDSMTITGGLIKGAVRGVEVGFDTVIDGTQIIAKQAAVFSLSGSISVTLRNLKACTDGPLNGFVATISIGSAGVDLTVEDSFLNSDATDNFQGLPIWMTAGSGSLTLSNTNIGSNGFLVNRAYNVASGITIDSDENHYETGSDRFTVAGTEYATLATLQSGEELDLNSAVDGDASSACVVA